MPSAPISLSRSMRSHNWSWEMTAWIEHHPSCASGSTVGLRGGFGDLFDGKVHQHVFHAAAVEDRVEAEGQLLRFAALVAVKPRAGDEHRLGKEDLLDLDQPVGDERAARGDDVEDAVGHAYRRGDLHGAFDGVDLGLDPLLGEVAGEDVGVGGGDAPAAEEREAFVGGRFGYGQREAAASEPEVHDLLDGETLLGDLVQPHDAQVGDPHRDGLRDVVVAQVEDFQRKAFRAGDEFALALGNADACFGKQVDALFVQSALGLDGYS